MNFKVSPSDLTYLYEGCKFCFWLKVRYGIGQPSMPMPGIFSAIAGRQKGFYADKRTEEFCPDLPPGKVLLGEKWVQSKAISNGTAHQCHIKGRFDAVLEFDDGSYGVIDFKTASPSDEKAEMYGRQLHAYVYSLENPEAGALHLAPVSKLGLIFFEPDSFEQQDSKRQLFTGRVIWIEVGRNDATFVQFIDGVLQVLGSDAPPQPAAGCPWCNYRSRTKDFSLEGQLQGREDQAASPSCPQCNGPMTLKNGKYGEFWSCQNFPNCRGTRKK